MFFFLSKTIGKMLLPTNFLIGVGVIGVLLLATRWASFGRRLMIFSILLLAICGFSPVGNWLLYPLESRFPAWDAARGAPDGIIILGGSIDANLSVGAETQTVEVTGTASVLQTQSGAVQSEITGQQIQNQELNGRNPLYQRLFALRRACAGQNQRREQDGSQRSVNIIRG